MKRLLSFLLTLCVCLSLLPAVGAAEGDHQMSDMEYDTLKLVNRERLKEGVPPLTSLPELQRGTDIRAMELVSLPEHTRPDGREWYTVFYEIDAPTYRTAGENIAAGFRRAEDVMEAWMNSDGHRRNILYPDFTHMGNGYYYTEDSSYKAHWVQIFHVSHSCQYTSMTLGRMSEDPVVPGTSIEEMRLLACLNCKTCGNAYLPVSEEYCTGYDPNGTGKQTLTVRALGFTATMDLTFPGEETQEPTEPEAPVFNDIRPGTWYEASVNFMVEQGLMNGVGKGRFNPEGKVTRAMLVTILYRAAGSPSVEGMNNPFKDVPQAWYSDGVIWAANMGVVNGVKQDRFDPEGNITREQIATILYRYEGSPEAPETLPPFADNGDISAYALKPMNWAIENGIINGIGGGRLAPRDTATRAQIATILARYLQA